jgi:heme/copper-type cytochrome/quinol oxidase subunit 2
LIGLTVVLKNVLNIPTDILSQDIVWYVIIYGIFFVSPYFTAEEKSKEDTASRRTHDNPWLWSAVVIIVTIAIIAFTAFFLT